MQFGRATLPKYIPFIIVGAVLGMIGALTLRGTAGAIFMGLCFLGMLGLFGFVAWVLLVKNKAANVASDTEKQQALQFSPVPGKGVLYLYRAQLVGLLAGLDVTLDGRNIGQTRGFSFFRLELEPGRHVLAGAAHCEPLEFNIDAGQVLLIEQEMTMGAVKGGYLYKISADDAHTRANIAKGKLFLPQTA